MSYFTKSQFIIQKFTQFIIRVTFTQRADLHQHDQLEKKHLHFDVLDQHDVDFQNRIVTNCQVTLRTKHVNLSNCKATLMSHGQSSIETFVLGDNDDNDE